MAQLYVIYNLSTTAIVKERAYSKQYYATEAAAKAAVTRFDRKGVCRKDEVAVIDANTYFTKIEGQVERVNMMSGQKYYESVNTPNCCSPSSETYWSA